MHERLAYIAGPQTRVLSGDTRKSNKVFIDFGPVVFCFAQKCTFSKKRFSFGVSSIYRAVLTMLGLHLMKGILLNQACRVINTN